MTRFLPFLFAFSFTVFLLGCRCEDEPADQKESAAKVKPPAEPSEENTPIAAQQLLHLRGRCELHHDGVVLDLGHSSVEARRDFRLMTAKPLERRTRSGTSVAELDQLKTTFTFWLDEPIEKAEFTALVFGTRSKRIAAYVDGKRLGGARIEPDELHVVRVRSTKDIEPGRHELTVSISKPRSGPPGAEVGWVRLGERGQQKQDHPPTRREVLSEVVIDGRPQEAVVLRPNSVLRCPVWVPENSHFAAQAGIWGKGTGVGEIAVRTPDGLTHQIHSVELTEDHEDRWIPIEAPLDRYRHQLVDIELEAPELSQGARLAFGQPSIVSSNVAAEDPKPAQRAIVLVLSGLSRRHAPPESAESGLPVINRFLAEATQFPGYRLPSTYAPATVATLLTGRQPWEHRVLSEGRAVDPTIVTLAERVEAQGGRAAMFTGVPTSFAPYGFDRGFGRFEAISPVEDEPATAPLDRAQKWLKDGLGKEGGPEFLVVHLRGGHPPFDIPQEEARKLPPKEYGGDLEPRRAAIQLSHYRVRSRRRNRRLLDEDWERLLAMQKRALLDQSATIARFFDWLQEHELYRDALVLITADLGAGEPPRVPFSENAPLENEYLQVPLIVKFPENPEDARRVEGTFTTVDVARTLAEALGISSDSIDPDSIDLATNQARETALLRSTVAYRDGKYATRQATFLLTGREGRVPRLCNTALDPPCSEDRTAEQPIAARALWHATWQELHAPLRTTPEAKNDEPIPDHQAALTVWGVPR